MDVETRFNLIKAVPTEEILVEDELKTLLEHGVPLVHYQGFEISGFVHLGTGLVSGLKIAQFQKAKVQTKLFLADFHSWINDKLGGDLETIQRVAKKYFAEAMKLSIKIMGGNPDAIEVILGSEFYEKNPEYWATVLDIAKHVSLARVRRAITILGRRMGEAIDFAKLIYPVMQVADIFALGVNLPHAGRDQRKAHVIAREVAKKIRFHQIKATINDNEVVLKPIAVHHSLLMGLKMSQEHYQILKEASAKGDNETIKSTFIDIKMSKSIPESAIFVHDPPEVIKKKIKGAFCPAREIEYNPVIAIARLIIFPSDGKFIVDRPAKFGGPVEYSSFEALAKDFAEGKLHPLDLKNAVANWLINKLEPIRKYFEGPGKNALDELKSIKITR